MSTRKILIIEDDPIILYLYKTQFERAGFEVKVANNGEAGFYSLHQSPPDAVLLDLMLPKINGYELCRKLKGDAHHQKVPVILFTAMAQQKDKQLGFQCGADAYVCKPFRTRELLDKIKELTPRKGGESDV